MNVNVTKYLLFLFLIASCYSPTDYNFSLSELNDEMVMAESTNYKASFSIEGELTCQTFVDVLYNGRVYKSFELNPPEVATKFSTDWYYMDMTFQVRGGNCDLDEIEFSVKMFD